MCPQVSGEQRLTRQEPDIRLEASNVDAGAAPAGGKADFLTAALAPRQRSPLGERILNCARDGGDIEIGGDRARQAQVDRAAMRVDVERSAARDVAGEVDRAGDRLDAGAVEAARR